MGNFEFSKYCTPAQLYLVLGAIGIIMSFLKNYSVETNLMHALFLVIWAWVLNWLCSKGFSAISWVLVLFPFIMMFFAYFFIKDVAKEAFEDEGFEDEGFEDEGFEDEGFFEGFFEGAKGKKKKAKAKRPQTDAEVAASEAAIKKQGEALRKKTKKKKQGFESFEGFEDEGFEDEGFEDEGFFEGITRGGAGGRPRPTIRF
jgi:hypothetical protein